MTKNWNTQKLKIVNFIKSQLEQRGFTKVVLGLSGGLDSAVVSVLCKEAIGQNLKTILMPSSTSSPQNLKDAYTLINKFDLPHQEIPIKHYDLAFRAQNKDASKERIGNFCARARMATLYDISLKENALVVGTSNKTELMLGYGTIFGDLAYALNPISSLFKTEIFEFGEFLEIPKEIIEKKPSADLFDGQSDEEDIGYTYAQIDSFLKQMVEENIFELESILKSEIFKKYKKSFIIDIVSRIEKNRFKLLSPSIF